MAELERAPSAHESTDGPIGYRLLDPGQADMCAPRARQGCKTELQTHRVYLCLQARELRPGARNGSQHNARPGDGRCCAEPAHENRCERVPLGDFWQSRAQSLPRRVLDIAEIAQREMKIARLDDSNAARTADGGQRGDECCRCSCRLSIEPETDETTALHGSIPASPRLRSKRIARRQIRTHNRLQNCTQIGSWSKLCSDSPMNGCQSRA